MAIARWGAFFLLFFWGSCKNTGTGTDQNSAGGGSGGLTANPPSVRLIVNTITKVSIIGSSRPDTIISPPNSSVATATLSDTVLTIHAGASAGATSVGVGDSHSPRLTVTVDITVATSAASLFLLR